MGPLHVRPEAEVREASQAAFEQHRSRVLAVLPAAEVEHVGSTAIAGAWTKGDVDLLVRLCDGEFDRAVVALRQLYSVHQRENWTETFASFIDSHAKEPPVGIQLVVTASRDDVMFVGFRDALSCDPALLEEYNALKRRHDGADQETYAAAKEAFVMRVTDSNVWATRTRTRARVVAGGARPTLPADVEAPADPRAFAAGHGLELAENPCHRRPGRRGGVSAPIANLDDDMRANGRRPRRPASRCRGQRGVR